MSLLTHRQARAWASSIRSRVLSRQMPPWHAEGEPGKWRNDRRLTQAEIDTIVAWVDVTKAGSTYPCNCPISGLFWSF